MKERNVMFTETDFRILDSYKSVLDGLAAYLGDGYEIVLHSLHDLDHSVIKIINGHYTGRREGFPISDLALSMLAKIEERPDTNCITYFNRNQKGEPLKSATIVIRNHSRMAIGLLCINFDSSRYRELSARVMDLCGSLLTPGAPSGTHLIVENDEHTYPSSIAGATASIVSSVIADYPVPVDRLTQDEKMEIMDALNRKGVFLLKGSVSHVARELHSPEASIYRYLGKLNNKD